MGEKLKPLTPDECHALVVDCFRSWEVLVESKLKDVHEAQRSILTARVANIIFHSVFCPLLEFGNEKTESVIVKYKPGSEKP